MIFLTLFLGRYKMGIYFVQSNQIGLLINNDTGLWWAYKVSQPGISRTIPIDAIEELQYIIPPSRLSQARSMYKLLSILAANCSPAELKFLILNVTSNCNLHCEYCYAKNQKKQGHMSLETMEKAIGKFFKATENSKNRVVAFHGGEPTLYYEDILRAVDLFADEKTDFIVQTNGTLLSEELIKEFSKRNIGIGISLDAIDNNQISLRGKDESYVSSVFNALERSVQYNNTTSVISILQKHNLPSMIKMTEKFFSLGITTVVYNLLWPTESQLYEHVADIDELLAGSIELFNYIQMRNHAEGLNIFEKYRERNLYDLWRNIFYAKNDYMCMGAPCGAGKTVVTIDERGAIYPCSLTLSVDGVLPGGNVLSDEINTFTSNPFRNLNNIKTCSNCPFKFTCGGGGCTGFIWKTTGTIDGESIYCKYYFQMILYMIEQSVVHGNLDSLTNINLSKLKSE